MTRDEIIAAMAHGVLVQHWLDAGCDKEQAVASACTQEYLDGDEDIGDDWSTELTYQRAALVALETADLAIVPVSLLTEVQKLLWLYVPGIDAEGKKVLTDIDAMLAERERQP